MSASFSLFKMTNTRSYLLLIFCFIFSCTPREEKKEIERSKKVLTFTNKVRLSSEIVWEKLNPARGDQSPQAGTIWGNRKDTLATGFLAKFVDGFSSPPHIHNVTYRAVVIKGKVHNDDPKADTMWMTPGSFWTQPKGEIHITSAQGEENIAYVEIDRGPYLVKPPSEAFGNGERPINIEASNVIWLDAKKSSWISPESKAAISFLWKQQAMQGLFVKLPAGFDGKIESRADSFQAILIKGEIKYKMPATEEIKSLDEGSYFSSTGEAQHFMANPSDAETILYLRTNGPIQVE